MFIIWYLCPICFKCLYVASFIVQFFCSFSTNSLYILEKNMELPMGYNLWWTSHTSSQLLTWCYCIWADRGPFTWCLGVWPNNQYWKEQCLFTIFQTWVGGSEHLSLEPSFPTRPTASVAPHQAISQKQPNSSPYSYLKPAAQTVLQSLWKVPKSPSSCSNSLLQYLGYVVISLHVIVQECVCPGALGHGEIQERHKSWESR